MNPSLVLSKKATLGTLASLALTVIACSSRSPVGHTSSATGGSGGATSTASSSTSTGGGSICGTFLEIPCAQGEYCEFPLETCGTTDEAGHCVTVPSNCPKDVDPTCACDGNVYDNPCLANAAGFDVANFGGCQAPAGQFGCGAHFCATASQYCQAQPFATPMLEQSQCLTVPAGCGAAPSCGCLSGVICGDACSAAGDGGLLVMCPPK
jgi:hypothetical protein